MGTFIQHCNKSPSQYLKARKIKDKIIDKERKWLSVTGNMTVYKLTEFCLGCCT